MQESSFLTGILYLLSMIGCGGGSDYGHTELIEPQIITTEIDSEKMQLYEESLAQWNQEKKEHQDSYQFTLSFTSAEGMFSFSNTFVVKKGIIVERSYEFSYDEARPDSQKGKESWTEKGAEIGSHADGFPPKTLTELYEDCGNIYLQQSPEDNYIYFDTKHAGILSICGYFPKNCADDCFEGVSLSDFKWL